jgi:uncharacterized membrane protein
MKLAAVLSLHRYRIPKTALILFAAAVLIGWFWYTPPGLLGKADAVGYAVCHRIPLRSFFLGDRALPLCARCSGMYLGALVGFLYHLRYPRRAGMPSRRLLAVLGLFLVVFGLDGVNSYLHFFPAIPTLYQPENWLRLLTGTGVGLGIAAVLVPVVRQSLYSSSDPRPALKTWGQMIVYISMGLVVDAALLSGNPLLLYPLALLSSATVLIILGLVYTVLWAMLTRQENRFPRLSAAWVLLLGGFTTAMLQIIAMDALRFLLTGTWQGFNLPVG